MSGVAPLAASASPEPRAGFRAWLSIFILLLLTLSSNIDRNIVGLLVDLIKADLKITDFEFSLLHGFAFAMFYVLASIPMGWAADRYSRRWILFLGAGFWSLCTAACGLAQNYWQLFVARFGVGIGEATLNPAAYSIVSDLFPKRRLTFAIACLACGAAIAAGLGAAGGGYLIKWAQDMGGFAGYAPWQVVFWVVGLPGVLVAPLVFLIPRVADRSAKRDKPADAEIEPDADAVTVPSEDGFLHWVRDYKAYFFCLSLGIGMHTAVGTSGIWLPAYLTRTHGLDIAQVGLLVGLVAGPPTIIGYLGGGWLVDYMVSKGVRDAHLRYLIANTVLLTVFGTVAYSVATSLTSVLVLLALGSVLVPCAGPAIAHLQMSVPSHLRGRAMAAFLMVMHFTGTIIGPSAAAFFSDYIYGGPQYIGLGLASTYALFGCASVAMFLFAMRPARRAISGS